MRSFDQLLIADLSEGIDIELLRYAATVRNAAARTKVLFSAAGARSLRTFAPAFKRIFPGECNEAPAIEVLPEPDLGTLLSRARSSHADLLLVRYLAGDLRQRELARRLLCDAPCSVWMVPEGFTGSVTRLVAAFDATARGAKLLGLSAEISRSLQAESLTAVNVWFSPTVLDPGEPPAHQERDWLCSLYRLLRSVDLRGVHFSLRAEHGPSASRRLIEAARENSTDLLVIRAPEVSNVGFFLRRDGLTDYLTSGLPLLAVRAMRVNGNRSGHVLRDLFGSSEPAFG